VFLYVKRSNLKKEGSLFLYKTQWGIKLINYVGEKYQRTLKFLSYVSITLGYFLMAGMVFLMGQSVYLYLTTEIAKTIKTPPIAPLIPYFPKLFGLQSFFPPFYFVYFIVAIIIVATVHEFSHGIFARRFGIKIKSTGFAFFKYFPAFFGAFVEQNDKQMEKAKKFEQMAVLSSGVFANILVTVLFYFILFGFFFLTFIPVGVQFNTYAYSVIDVGDISSINGIPIDSYDGILNSANETGLNKLIAGNKSYIGTKDILSEQQVHVGQILVYEDAPAVNAQIGMVITNINGVKINNLESLQEELNSYSPGESIQISTLKEGEVFEDVIVLKENPEKKGVAWLGIGFYESSQGKISKLVLKIFPSYKKPFVYYKPVNEISLFVKDFLWWIFIVNLLVALLNMLPLGILDGGRFFYLTIWGLTGSEKFAKKSFVVVTYLILLLFLTLILKWLFSFF